MPLQQHKFETVGMIPKSYFDQEQIIYGFTERIIDGDTIRVRHIPNYIFQRYILQTFHPNIYQTMITPLQQQRGIAHETLSIRLYGVDCPEVSKRSSTSSSSQPFAIEAKELTTQLCHHQIVKITLLRRDQYQRAVAKVEVWTTMPSPSVSNTNSWWSSLTSSRQKKKKKKKQRHVDVSMELAQAGLAELYMGGGAEYHHSYDEFERVIQEAQRHRRGIWSIPQHQYISAAEYKKEHQKQPSKSMTQQHKKRVNGYVVDATTATTTTNTNTNRWRSKQGPKRNTGTTMTMIGMAPTTSTVSDTKSHTYRNDHHHHHHPLMSNRHSNSKHRREDQQYGSHRHSNTNKKPTSKTTNIKSTMFETALTGLEILG